ncbi:hypothetical protein IV203_035571 [Nitzschia inconspicua]|uniref:Uncharacterized protein n=1 Tax=Nitzschia inconspicua TaxID=303405 RepID=A0A9K3LE35_9STRA|nr:hypothetical protein IV203_035571 [Nitzschia inconspicua]
MNHSSYRYGSKPQTNSTQRFSEFAFVVVMHFVQKADDIESQLQEWTAQDPSLKNHVQTVRNLLQRAIKQNHNFQSEGYLKAAAACGPPNDAKSDAGASAVKNTLKTAEIIEIL